MNEDNPWSRESPTAAAGPQTRILSAAAMRALAEAEARRAERERQARADDAKGGSALDPTRYGDWEVKGIATDF